MYSDELRVASQINKDIPKHERTLEFTGFDVELIKERDDSCAYAFEGMLNSIFQKKTLVYAWVCVFVVFFYF